MQLHDATPKFGDSITIVRSADGPFEPQKILALSGAEVGDAIWEQISELAVKTYVPSNQVSRARGAGAGLTDND